ncbi:hypothetical protein FACS1894123_05870 [Bacteroidia bacterium]|nr:hypothetical protein FACS1894123_05870 [Bacteroidia bacterium]
MPDKLITTYQKELPYLPNMQGQADIITDDISLLEKKKLYEFYTLADIGVACSLHEEFGFVAIEMMMHALPLIVTETGGLDEIVEDNISGLKIPVETQDGKRQISAQFLSDKMEYLLTHPVEAKALGQNGRKRFLDKYELSLFKEKMLNLYQNI